MLNKIKIALICVMVCSIALCIAVNCDTDAYAETMDKCDYSIGDNLLYDSGFEIDGTSEFTDAREISSKWKTASWAGTDASYWGYKSTKHQAYLICSASGLLDGENPVVYQDVAVQKNTYYVISFYARAFGGVQGMSDLVVGVRDPNGNDPWTNIQQYAVDSLDDPWEHRYVVIYSGTYQTLRICLFTTSMVYDGTLTGYHIDDVEMYRADSPEDVSVQIPTLHAGEMSKLSIKAKFSGGDEYVSIEPNAFIRTNLSADSNIISVDDKGNVFAKEAGVVNINGTVSVFNKTFQIDQQQITIESSTHDVSISDVTVRAEDINFSDLSALSVSVYLSDGTVAPYDSYSVEYTSTNPKVACIRTFNGVSYATATGNGNADIVAHITSDYGDAIGTLPVSVTTDNYLVDPGFEAQYDYRFWKTEGLAGCNVDDGKTNVYMHGGIANFWIMAPVWWDESVKPDSYARISQVVTLEQGKYALSAYMRRYNATGVDGMLSGQGGIVTIGAIKLDDNLNETDVVYSREFDTSYGTGSDYGKISTVFDVLAQGNYLVFFRVDGDATYGLGMQVDDMSLTKANYPEKITASIYTESDVLAIDDICKITVTAHYADGSTEVLSEDLRFFFDDYYVACQSAGFVVAKSGGTTTMRVVASVLDRQYETSLEINVASGSVTSTGNPTWYWWVIGAVSIVVVGVTVVVLIVRRKTKEDK